MTESAEPFRIVYAPVTREHLRAIERKYYSLIRETIAEQVTISPMHETRNRKPLKRPILVQATWELRFGPDNRFRVFYDVDRSARQVTILAIGVKVGATITIGGEEHQL